MLIGNPSAFYVTVTLWSRDAGSAMINFSSPGSTCTVRASLSFFAHPA
jgi:hypothetical protein